MLQVALTLKSSNKKTGPIPVSTTSAQTCPTACPLSRGGCYAKGGPLAIHWNRVTNGTAGMPWDAFLRAIKALPAGQLWRHNQAGDLPGEGNAIDKRALTALVNANAGRRGFTYTHKPPHLSNNAKALRAANAAGFTVNLSANSLAHADALADLNAGPVVSILPADQLTNTKTPAGRTVVICPAVTRENVIVCQLRPVSTREPSDDRGIPRARQRAPEGLEHCGGRFMKCAVCNFVPMGYTDETGKPDNGTVCFECQNFECKTCHTVVDIMPHWDPLWCANCNRAEDAREALNCK